MVPFAATCSEEALDTNKVCGIRNIFYVLFFGSNSSIQGNCPVYPIIMIGFSNTIDIQK
jgi:hypothetical protein